MDRRIYYIIASIGIFCLFATSYSVRAVRHEAVKIEAHSQVLGRLARYERLRLSDFTSGRPDALLYTDITGDGVKDIVVLQGGRLTMRPGTANGSFSSEQLLAGGLQATRLFEADTNGDGRTELLLLNTQASLIEAVRYTGSLVETLYSTQIPYGATDALAGDFNSDGYSDLALAADGLQVLYGSEMGLKTGIWLEDRLRVDALAADGHNLYAATSAGILVWKNRRLVTTLPQQASAIALGDLNSDGRNELIAASRDGLLAVYPGLESGFGTPRTTTAIVDPKKIESAHADADGRLDLLIGGSSRVAVMRGSGDYGFAAPSFIADDAPVWIADRVNLDALADLVTAGSELALVVTQATTITVTNTNDSGPGSLRQALTDALATGDDTIVFNISTPPTGGIHVITLASALPAISNASTVIDGTTQATNVTDSNPDGPEIFIDAANAGGFGLQITSNNNIVRGIGIIRSTGPGIQISGSGVNGNIIEGCYIGTNKSATGTSDTTPSISNTGNVIGVRIAAGSFSNTVGGTTAATRNIISGNSSYGVVIDGANSNTITGNTIGLNRTAVSGVGNGDDGVIIQNVAVGNTISNNLIGKNNGAGVTVSGGGTILNTIRGNVIGTNGDAAKPNLGNTGSGILIAASASQTTVGGTASGAQNTIAFNGGDGVTVGTSTVDTGATRNAIQRNSIFGNTGEPIDLGNDGVTPNDSGDADSGPNNLQNFAENISVTQSANTLTITGKQDSPSANSITVEIYAVFSNNMQFLTTVTPAANGSFTATASAPSGNFTIRATSTDSNGNTSEFSDAVTVTQQPDLIVQNLSISPTSTTAGSTISVSFTIRNQGSAAASTSASTVVLSNDNKIELTDTQLATVPTPALNSNTTSPTLSATVTVPSTLQPGKFFIGVVADAFSSITESNENNNTQSLELTIGALQADLAVGAYSLSTSTVALRGSLQLNLTVSNLGGASAGASLTQIVLSTDSSIGTGDLPLASIPTGAIPAESSLPLSTQITLPESVQPGNYFVGVILDANSAVTESNETNNTAARQLAVSGLSDLIVETLTVSPTGVTPGGTITIEATVRNIGSTATPNSSTELFISDDSTITNADTSLSIRPTAALMPNAATTVQVTVALSPNLVAGQKFIGAIADSGNLIVESNETNNTRSTSINILDLINPQVTVISPNGSEPIATGREFQIKWASSDNIAVVSHEIRLSTDGGNSFPVIITAGLAGNVTTFAWTPDNSLNSTTARIQVIARDAAGNTANDSSDADFTVAAPPTIVEAVLNSTGQLKFKTPPNGNIQTGAVLRVTIGAQTEEFTLKVSSKRANVPATATSRPSGRTISELLTRGTQATLVIVNPNGISSNPFPFVRQ